jgi:D-methionine transport system ATP-binding protein
VTVVVITHEMSVVDRICHRVAVIDKSRIVEMGAVDEIFANPQSAIARELILPHVKVASVVQGGAHVRLAFNGESTCKPVVSALILETGVPVSILFADTHDIGGKTYGQMLLELPAEERLAQRVRAWLDANFPSYSLEV